MLGKSLSLVQNCFLGAGAAKAVAFSFFHLKKAENDIREKSGKKVISWPLSFGVSTPRNVPISAYSGQSETK